MKKATIPALSSTTARVMFTISYDFGSCSNPGIIYDPSNYSFKPSDAVQFSFTASPDIATLESEICRQLRHDECGASSEATVACDQARWSFSGFAGQQAADAWNRALGLDGEPLAGGTSTIASATPTPDSSSEASPPSFSSSPSASFSASSQSTSNFIVVQARSTRASTQSSSPSSSSTNTESSTPSANSEDSDGSPFDAQNSSIPMKPKTSILGLTIVLLLLTSLY